ncbi:uncharacterized protein LOC111080328 [Drosophila obscura]|uniref:uncharacterized protein LOC111080328 n=1 Tax=Drosophila obscura TaxID=7282 RepID=UPI001BB16A55|nr:uncharacterized protein LOC111080328 [Drosophila obscura]
MPCWALLLLCSLDGSPSLPVGKQRLAIPCSSCPTRLHGVRPSHRITFALLGNCHQLHRPVSRPRRKIKSPDQDDEEKENGNALEIEEHPPALCPIDDCMEQVAHSHLLRHIMSAHMNCSGTAELVPVQTQMKEVATGATTLLLLDYRHMPLGRDLCLAVLNWRGDGCSWDLSVPQRDLPLSVQALSLHVPVVVMVCRTTWKSVLTPPSQRPGPNEPRDVTQELGKLLLIWLLCPAIRRPVAVTLTIINSKLKVLKRTRRMPRVHTTQFITGPNHYFLHIDEDDLEELCDCGKSAVFLQLVIDGELQPQLSN